MFVFMYGLVHVFGFICIVMSPCLFFRKISNFNAHKICMYGCYYYLPKRSRFLRP